MNDVGTLSAIHRVPHEAVIAIVTSVTVITVTVIGIETETCEIETETVTVIETVIGNGRETIIDRTGIEIEIASSIESSKIVTKIEK